MMNKCNGVMFMKYYSSMYVLVLENNSSRDL